MANEDAAQAVHDALKLYLDDDEIAVSWLLTIDVAGTDNVRYLAHRSGGGADGTEQPTVWTAVGMLKAGVLNAEDQLLDMTRDFDDADDADDDDGD